MSRSKKALQVKIKRLHPDAIIPTYAKTGDAGLDLTAIDNGTNVYPADKPGNSFYYREYSTGIAVEIPEGYVGLIFPRSSISNTGFSLSNSVGVIDSGYRGEIKFRFKVDGAGFLLQGVKALQAYNKGDRIGQIIIMPYPKVELLVVDELSQSERGDKGFGSTNAK